MALNRTNDAHPTALNRETGPAMSDTNETQDRLVTSGDGSKRRAICKCGVYEYVHREGRGCGYFRKASRIRVWLQHHSVWAHIAAPIWLRIPEKRRWTVVSWLNKSQRRCWADLVSDALTYRESDPCDVRVPCLRAERAPRCASVCGWFYDDHTGQHACSCYCGKFQFAAPDGVRDREAASS